MVRRWVWRSDGAAIPRAFADTVADLGVAYAPLVARCLWNREVRDRDAAASFLRPTLAHGLRSPLLLKDMARAAARLADALAGHRASRAGGPGAPPGRAQATENAREFGVP